MGFRGGPSDEDHMSHSLDSLKGLYRGLYRELP